MSILKEAQALAGSMTGQMSQGSPCFELDRFMEISRSHGETTEWTGSRDDALALIRALAAVSKTSSMPFTPVPWKGPGAQKGDLEAIACDGASYNLSELLRAVRLTTDASNLDPCSDADRELIRESARASLMLAESLLRPEFEPFDLAEPAAISMLGYSAMFLASAEQEPETLVRIEALKGAVEARYSEWRERFRLEH